MTFPSRMTESQKRLAFRAAVQASLERFYGQHAPESRMLLSAWWMRISTSSAFKSGLLMQDEPIDTAAKIVHRDAVKINAKTETVYAQLLQNAIQHRPARIPTVEPATAAPRMSAKAARSLQQRQLAASS
jgi:7-keto-8-aminopelargonate synthetase-like enzyme